MSELRLLFPSLAGPGMERRPGHTDLPTRPGSGAQAVPTSTILVTVPPASWLHLVPSGWKPQRGRCCHGAVASCAPRFPLFSARELCICAMLSSVWVLARGQMTESYLLQHEQSKEILGLETQVGQGGVWVCYRLGQAFVCLCLSSALLWGLLHPQGSPVCCNGGPWPL